MIISLLFICALSNDQCTKHFDPISIPGSNHYTITLSTNDQYCINISYFPFYIVFYEVASSVTYHEYYSRSLARITNQDFNATGKDIPLFRAFELPYGSITLTTSKDNARVRFTIVCMPGLCKTGIVLSTSKSESYVLEPNQKGFLHLSNLDDKCFVFANPGVIRFAAAQVSTDDDDQFFIYESYYNYTSYTGTFSEAGSVGNNTNAPVFRILTTETIQPSKFRISFSTDLAPENPKTEIHIPRHREPGCEEVQKWYSEELVITLITLSCFFAVILVVIVVCQFTNRKQHIA